jgi:hypothetical protein
MLFYRFNFMISDIKCHYQEASKIRGFQIETQITFGD